MCKRLNRDVPHNSEINWSNVALQEIAKRHKRGSAELPRTSGGKFSYGVIAVG
jgi:hypothetical protein